MLFAFMLNCVSKLYVLNVFLFHAVLSLRIQLVIVHDIFLLYYRAISTNNIVLLFFHYTVNVSMRTLRVEAWAFLIYFNMAYKAIVLA